MRILAASDLHGESKLTKKLAEKALKENVDLVVLCGDILGWVETKDIIKPFQEVNKKVVILPGNWDDFSSVDFIAERYGIKNIHGYALQVGNLGIFGVGGASDSPGPGKISERELFEMLRMAYDSLKTKKGIEKKLMVTHMHPAESLSEFSGVPGSKSILKAVKEFKPEFLLHGHIHEADGLSQKMGKTKVINVGKTGKIIEL